MSSTREAVSQTQAASAPTTLPVGTGAIGRPSVRASEGLVPFYQVFVLYMRWRCRAMTFMRGVILRRRAGLRLPTWPNGTGAVGRRSVWGWTDLCTHWACQVAIFMSEALSRQRAGS